MSKYYDKQHSILSSKLIAYKYNSKQHVNICLTSVADQCVRKRLYLRHTYSNRQESGRTSRNEKERGTKKIVGQSRRSA